jgi:uncharacterized coiled-coil protein SlyX
MATKRAIREISAAVSVAALAFVVAPAVAGTTLTLPASGSGAVDGGGLRVTNTEDNPGSGHPQPFGIEGNATGEAAGGVLGRSTKADSIGVYGLNVGSGFGGYFLLSGAAAGYGDSALDAVHSGGSKSINGPYGNAGFFEISNKHNTDTALFVETFGNGNAFHAETHGVEAASAAEGYDYGSGGGGTGVFGYSLDGTAAEFIHGSGGGNSCSFDGASSGWNCTKTAAMMDNPAPVDLDTLLRRLAAMPIVYFTTKGARVPARELGASAEDFRAAFGLGRDGKSVAEGNADGVALAAAKGLYRKLEADEAETAAQQQNIAALEEQLASQRAVMAGLATAVAGLVPRAGMQAAQLSSGQEPLVQGMRLQRP